MQQSRGGVAAAQHQRARLPSLSLSLCPRRPQGLAGRPSLVLVRADPKVEGTREFREDTGEVSGPSSKKNADGSIYVDDSAPKPMKPRDNMSKEMKARLRQEYVGFGGAENKSMGGNYFFTICVVISVLAVMSKLIGAI